MKVSRRGLFKDAGVFLLGATLGGLSSPLPNGVTAANMGTQEIEIPWPYKKLNPEAVAEDATLPQEQNTQRHERRSRQPTLTPSDGRVEAGVMSV